ncbi:hypothetical protein EON64_20285 [archaeon]|nr:MAG: hypothetical protein EON64_20285 [archaeon]
MGGMDGGEEASVLNNQSFSQQLTQQIAHLEAETEDNIISFAVGDHVLVIGGELQTLVARIVSLDDLRKTAKVVALKGDLPGEFDIEWNLLVKHVVVGAHVKVGFVECIHTHTYSHVLTPYTYLSCIIVIVIIHCFILHVHINYR